METFFGGASPSDTFASHQLPLHRHIRRGVWSSSPQEEDAWIDALLLSAASHNTHDGVVSDATNIPRRGIPIMRNAEIAKIIHFVWLGEKSMPSFSFLDDKGQTSGESDNNNIAKDDQRKSQWNECMQSWKKHHPSSHGWKINVWTQQDIADSIHNIALSSDGEKHYAQQPPLFELVVSNMHNAKGYQHAMEKRNYGMASDILRLEILKKFGGVYVDIDYWCVGSLDDIVTSPNTDTAQFLCGASNTACIELNNGLMACKKGGHPILWNMMNSIHAYFEGILVSPVAPPCHNLISMGALLSSFLDTTTVNALEISQASKDKTSLMEVIEHTGPGLLTRSVCRWLVGGDAAGADCDLSMNNCAIFGSSQVVVFSSLVFHPFPNHLRKELPSFCEVSSSGNAIYSVPGDENRNNKFKDKLEALFVSDETRAIHLWGCSWQDS